MPHNRPKPRLLILSFFDISIDPRVMKQVRLFAEDYDVTTCAPGPLPHQDVEHIELDVHWVRPRGRVGNAIDDLARAREWFAWSYRQTPIVQQIREKLRGRVFDVAIANDADAVGVANDIVGADRVHADLHEFFPGLPQPDNPLGERQRRYWTWLVREHCAKSVSSTTVGAEIAHRYGEYGLTPGVVTNATHLRNLPVRETGSPIRIVHSGNPFRDRGLGEIMTAVAHTTSDVTLDLYLMKHNEVELAAVAELAESLGDRIRILDPVSQSELVETLNGYDVGIHVLPPTSENNSLALPNKFFDFIQARLAVIVGPSLEMARIVTEHGLGIVTEDFSERSIRAALDALTVADIDRAKRASDAAAPALSSESQVGVWKLAVERIVEARGTRA